VEEPVLTCRTKPLLLALVAYLWIPISFIFYSTVAWTGTLSSAMVDLETASTGFSLENGQTLQTCQRSAHRIVYLVQPGDILGEIADRFGVSVSDIQQWNNLADNSIRSGEELFIHGVSSQEELMRQWLSYLVEPGDTLSQIAENHEVSISNLLSWNRGIQANAIQIGQEIRIRADSRQFTSSSIGTPQSGRLSRGFQLQNNPGYIVRNPTRAFGTEVSVEAISYAFTNLRLHFPQVTAVSIGDLSFATGGRMSPHLSHQTGRDADIGYFTTHDRGEGANGFIVASPENLDVVMTWYLFKSFIDQGTV
jgi:LysM repeat protein